MPHLMSGTTHAVRTEEVTDSVERLREWLKGDYSKVGGLAHAHVHTLVEATPRLLHLVAANAGQGTYAIELQRICEAMSREARCGDGHLTPATAAAAPHHAAMLADVTALRQDRDALQARLDALGAPSAVPLTPPRVRAEETADRPVDLALFAQNVAELTWGIAARHPFEALGPQARLAVQDQITAVASAVTALESGGADAQARVNAIEWPDAREQLVEGILRTLGDRQGADALVEAVYSPGVARVASYTTSA